MYVGLQLKIMDIISDRLNSAAILSTKAPADCTASKRCSQKHSVVLYEMQHILCLRKLNSLFTLEKSVHKLVTLTNSSTAKW